MLCDVDAFFWIPNPYPSGLRRCYTCRSRGDLGDCKDPFVAPPPFNASDPSASLERHVKLNPCNSGWCFKQIDGEIGNSANNAVERGCMVRKPSDNEERCTYIKRGYKKVFMCFCRGDQCNSVSTLSISIATLLVPVLLLWTFCWRCWRMLKKTKFYDGSHLKCYVNIVCMSYE